MHDEVENLSSDNFTGGFGRLGYGGESEAECRVEKIQMGSPCGVGEDRPIRVKHDTGSEMDKKMMNSKTPQRIACGLLCAACIHVLPLFSVEAKAAEKPDILFILIDDLRYDGLSYKGHPYVQTPHIDKLRDLGADMENAFVTTSICCPSRATFLTGTYASRHGVIDNGSAEYNPEVTPPLTKYLQEAGYQTAMIGKWHMAHSAEPRAFFDQWISFEGQGKYNDVEVNENGKKIQWKGYTTDLLTDETIQFIEAQPKDQPYFCMLSHKAVHEKCIPHSRHKNAFGKDRTDPEPVSWSTGFEGKPDWQLRLNDQLHRNVKWHDSIALDYRTRDLETEILPDSVPQKKWDQKQTKYTDQFRCLAAIDDGVGKLLAALKKRGTLENTLIVFASDNGYFHGEHRRHDKRLANEESLRIPMVIAYPGHIKAGSTVTELVQNLDFAPTVLSYAGIDLPEQMQGRNMRPLFEQKEPDWRESIFYEYWVELSHSIPTMTAVRTDRYKLIRYPEIKDIDELYDLQNDPHELNNLARNPEYAALHKDMEKILDEQVESTGWQGHIVPKNLPRIRGSEDFNVDYITKPTPFDGTASTVIQKPYNEDADPSSWPWQMDIEVKAESDGVIAAQSNPRFGFKIFVQDGRPGIALLCKTWVPVKTVIDGPESILGKWTKLQASIDYNRIIFAVDGKIIESRALPQPFKVRTQAPLFIGGPCEHPVVDDVPHQPFKGEIRQLTTQRSSLAEL